VRLGKSALALFVFTGGLAWPPVAFSEDGNSQPVPNLSGGWARIGTLVETFEAIPGYSGAGPMLVDPLHPHREGGSGQDVQWVAQLDNPILKPAIRAKLQTITEEELQGISHLKNEGLCQPSGVPMILNRRGAAVQILQTPTQIVMLNARDSQARFIYLNMPHSKNPGHSWYGESVGHYEGGDTLVVDTIGQNDRTQVDRFGTPHSDQIHVIERYKISPDRRTMEVQFTVDDPGAFTMPWSARARFATSSDPWNEEVCAENNRFIGSVSVDGKVTKTVTIPTADRPDF
jgi:hypothetical protein